MAPFVLLTGLGRLDVARQAFPWGFFSSAARRPVLPRTSGCTRHMMAKCVYLCEAFNVHADRFCHAFINRTVSPPCSVRCWARQLRLRARGRALLSRRPHRAAQTPTLARCTRLSASAAAWHSAP
eukprot:6109278-Pyramimonas_sp.AAC.1